MLAYPSKATRDRPPPSSTPPCHWTLANNPPHPPPTHLPKRPRPLLQPRRSTRTTRLRRRRSSSSSSSSSPASIPASTQPRPSTRAALCSSRKTACRRRSRTTAALCWTVCQTRRARLPHWADSIRRPPSSRQTLQRKPEPTSFFFFLSRSALPHRPAAADFVPPEKKKIDPFEKFNDEDMYTLSHHVVDVRCDSVRAAATSTLSHTLTDASRCRAGLVWRHVCGDDAQGTAAAE